MKLNTIKTLFLQVLILTVVMKGVFAEDVAVIGSIKQTFKQSSTNPSSRYVQSDNVIKLLRIQLSDEAKEHLANQAKDALKHIHQFSLIPSHSETLPLPDQVQLKMNKVPVLDQGRHGTCVTFAVTGAIDAVIGKGDYISQLCNLQLGSYLEQHGYGLSGWNGS